MDRSIRAAITDALVRSGIANPEIGWRLHCDCDAAAYDVYDLIRKRGMQMRKMMRDCRDVKFHAGKTAT